MLLYYGAISFLDFVTGCMVRRIRQGYPGHGLSVTCSDEGWQFDKDWPRKCCFVEMSAAGDFPYFVDALTIAGWPSLFSGFQLHRESKRAPWRAIENPAPLLKSEKLSLDLLCNFDFARCVQASPGLDDWIEVAGKDLVWKITGFLLDFAVAYVASCLSRYNVPAWREIIDGEKSGIYADFNKSFQAVVSDAPFFFSGEHPFQYSFQTQIGP